MTTVRPVAARLIAVSQRVDVIAGRNERRDALDQRWTGFLDACGLLPVAMPNTASPALAAAWLEAVAPAGILLTGGNDLTAYGGDAPERDAVETLLIEHAVARRIPLMAVCRGLQMLMHHFGAGLERVTGHTGTEHPVVLGDGGTDTVNSYHNWAFTSVPPGFTAWATAPDGVVEAVRHDTLPLLGMLWHPERNAPYRAAEIDLVRRHFGVDR
jgi:putative glutamine amidotransferase